MPIGRLEAAGKRQREHYAIYESVISRRMQGDYEMIGGEDQTWLQRLRMYQSERVLHVVLLLVALIGYGWTCAEIHMYGQV